MKFQKPPLSKIVPSEYRELFDKITNPWVFAQDKWYKLPEDSFKIDFLSWYYRAYGCIEYSETNTHFKVTFWPLLRKPGLSLTDKDFEEINSRYGLKKEEPEPKEAIIEEEDLDGL